MADGQDPGAAGQRLTRLRWRLRGAWQWPTFIVLTLVEALMVHLLPIAGDSANALGAFLLCAFANLGVVALLAPLAGRWLRRRRPHLPSAVAADYAGTTLLVALFATLLAIGLAHHPAVGRAHDTYRIQLAAVRRYLAHQAPPEYARNVGRESTWKQAPDLFRTCVPGPDPRRDLCLIVDTSGPSPSVVRDPDQQPNSVVAGPDNPGRRGA